MFKLLGLNKCDFCGKREPWLVSRFVQKSIYTMEILICKECLQDLLRLIERSESNQNVRT